MELFCQNDSDESCYGLSKIDETFSNAKTICNEAKGTLFIPDTEVELDFVRQRIGTEKIWVGVINPSQDNTNWINAETGSAISYTNWKDGEPDEVEQECVYMNQNGQWHDIKCDKTFGFVCEFAPDAFASNDASIVSILEFFLYLFFQFQQHQKPAVIPQVMVSRLPTFV